MADTLTIRALVEVLLKGGQLPATLRADLEKLRGQAEKTAVGVGNLDKALGGFRRSLVTFLGGAALARFAQTSLTEFAKLERGFGALGFQLDQLGLRSAENLPKVREALHAIQAGGGALQTETLPIMQRFIGITKNVNEALALTKLAADAGESGFIETGQAAEALANILQGRARGAAQALGIEFFKLNGTAKTNGELMTEAIAKFDGLGDKVNDTQNSLERFAGTWADVKQQVGQAVAIIAGPAAKAFDALVKAIKTGGAIMGNSIDLLITAFGDLGTVLATAFDFKKLFTDPKEFLKSLQDAVGKGLRDIALSNEAMADDLTAIWGKAGKDSGDALKKGLTDAVEQANRAQARAELLGALETAAKVAQARVDAAKKGSQEELDARLALIDAQYAAEVEKNKQAGQSIAGLDKARLAERAATLKQFTDAQVEAESEAQQKLAAVRAAGIRKGTQEELAARLDAINKAYDAEIQKANQSAGVLSTLEMARQAALANEKKDFAEEEAARELAQEAELIQAKIGLEEGALARSEGNQQEHLDRLAELERALLDVQYQSEIEAADDTGKEVAKIRETYALLSAEAEAAINQRKLDAIQEQEINAAQLDVEASEANTKARYDAELALLKATYGKRIAAAKQSGSDVFKIQQAYAIAERELALQLAADKVAIYARAAGMILGQLQAAFGDNKAFAIANAIINTALAVTQTLAEPGLPYYVKVALAVAMAALGAVQVAKIASTSPGGGGGVASPSGGASVSASGRGGGARSQPSPARPTGGERPSTSQDRFSGATAGPATSAFRRERERTRGGETRTQTIINNDNRTTTFAPSTTVRMEGVIATTRTQVYKDLSRGLARVERTHIRRGRING